MKFKELDYKNKRITKKNWKSIKVIKFISYMSSNSYGDPEGLYLCYEIKNSIHIRGYIKEDPLFIPGDEWEEL